MSSRNGMDGFMHKYISEWERASEWDRKSEGKEMERKIKAGKEKL